MYQTTTLPCAGLMRIVNQLPRHSVTQSFCPAQDCKALLERFEEKLGFKVETFPLGGISMNPSSDRPDYKLSILVIACDNS